MALDSFSVRSRKWLQEASFRLQRTCYGPSPFQGDEDQPPPRSYLLLANIEGLLSCLFRLAPPLIKVYNPLSPTGHLFHCIRLEVC